MSIAPPLENLRLRHRLLRQTRDFLDGAGYVEVETPVLVSATVPETHLDLVEASRGRLLQASPEPHMKRLVAAGMRRVYQISKVFRDGEEGPWHSTEFTMLEWYREGDDLAPLAAELEALVERLCAAIGRPAPRFETVPVDDLFEREAGWRPSRDWDEERFFLDLVEKVEPALPRPGAVILERWPAAAASLARIDPDDPLVCQRFELYLDGVEIANAFSELADPVEQRRRLEEANARRAREGRASYAIDERFIEALRSGLPRCTGIAVGVDRLVAVLLGEEGIASVMGFAGESAGA